MSKWIPSIPQNGTIDSIEHRDGWFDRFIISLIQEMNGLNFQSPIRNCAHQQTKQNLQQTFQTKAKNYNA